MARKAKTYPELDKRRDLLGTVPDATVAELAGTSPSIVGRYRRKYNIPAYQGYKFGHDVCRALGRSLPCGPWGVPLGAPAVAIFCSAGRGDDGERTAPISAPSVGDVVTRSNARRNSNRVPGSTFGVEWVETGSRQGRDRAETGSRQGRDRAETGPSPVRSAL